MNRKDFEYDVYKYFRKTYSDFKKIKEEFDTSEQNIDHILFGEVMKDNRIPTHEELIKAHNTELMTAYVLTTIFPRELEEFDNKQKLKLVDHPIFSYFLLKEKANELAHGKNLFEYGCGACDTAFTLWQLGFNMTLSDLPMNWLKFLEFRIKKYNIPRIKFCFVEKQLDFLPDEQYDCFYTHDVLEHVLEPDKVIQYISAHLTPGALSYIEYKFTGGDSHINQNNKLFGIEADGIFNDYGNQIWREKMRDAGFVPLPLGWNWPRCFWRKLKEII